MRGSSRPDCASQGFKVLTITQCTGVVRRGGERACEMSVTGNTRKGTFTDSFLQQRNMAVRHQIENIKHELNAHLSISKLYSNFGVLAIA